MHPRGSLHRRPRRARPGLWHRVHGRHRDRLLPDGHHHHRADARCPRGDGRGHGHRPDDHHTGRGGLPRALGHHRPHHRERARAGGGQLARPHERQLHRHDHRPRLGRRHHALLAPGIWRGDSAHHRLRLVPLRVQDVHHGGGSASPRPRDHAWRLRLVPDRHLAQRDRGSAHHHGLLALRHGGRVQPHERERQAAPRRCAPHLLPDLQLLDQRGHRPNHQHHGRDARASDLHAGHRRRHAQGLRLRHPGRRDPGHLLQLRRGLSAPRHLEDARAQVGKARGEVRQGREGRCRPCRRC